MRYCKCTNIVNNIVVAVVQSAVSLRCINRIDFILLTTFSMLYYIDTRQCIFNNYKKKYLFKIHFIIYIPMLTDNIGRLKEGRE